MIIKNRKPPVLSLLRKLHAWAGLLLCLLLVPIALSGASLVFKPQWLRASVPGAEAVAPIGVADAARAMTDARVAFPEARSVTFAGPEIGLHQVSTPRGGGYLALDGSQPVRTWGRNERVVDWLFDLHHHLLIGETGELITGWLGVLATSMVLTGVIIWFPAWRNFTLRVVPARASLGSWLAAHRNLGVLAAPVILVIAVTGAAMALDDASYRILGFERLTPPVAGTGEINWSQVLAQAQSRFPDAELRVASWPRRDGQTAVIRLRQPGEWHNNGRTYVHIDPATSAVVAVEDVLTGPPGARVFATFWPLHASKVGGLPWKIATFLGGIALATLAIYGAESYRRKLFPERRKRQAVMVPGSSSSPS